MNQNEQIRKQLCDKMAVIEVLGNLMNNSSLLTEGDFKLKKDDFPERFHQIVFGSIEFLADRGMEKINPIDIDQFLSRYEVQYRVFLDNKGFEYVTRAMELADEKKFEYYRLQLKKYSALYRFYEVGMDISEFFNPQLTDPDELSKLHNRFDAMDLYDLVSYFEGKIATVSTEFACNRDVVEGIASSNLRKLKDSFKEGGDMGEPLMSGFCTALFRGQRLKKLFIESAPSGGGKSRKALGEAARLAIPEFYDTKANRWVVPKAPHRNGVLFITTELQMEEVQVMLLAYVSGVNENHIRNGIYEANEESRVDRAMDYIDQSHLYFVAIGEYDMDDIERIIKKYKAAYNVRYVFFDYLMATFKMMSGSSSKVRSKNLREDQYLLDGVLRLKNLANRLNIYIHTGTQLSREYKNSKEIDATVLRGAMAIADKADIGLAMLPVREDDKPIIEEYMRKGFTTRPNMVLHIFKMRQVNKVTETKLKVYGYFDYGTCRFEDCFVTNLSGEFLNVEREDVERITAEELNDPQMKWGGFVL